MESEIFLDHPVIKTIQSPRLVSPIKYLTDSGPAMYFLKNPQKGLGVMCIDFLIKTNYLGIFWEPHLVPHFSNSFLNAGSFKYNEIEISQKLQNFGAHLQFETNRMYSLISVYSISNQINHVLPILAELILRPIYPNTVIQDRMKNEKKKFLISMERSEIKSSREIKKILYGDLHPYGRLVTEQDFDNIDKKDLTSFHNDIYNINNLEIIISGDFTDEIAPLISHNFCQMKAASHDCSLREKSIFNLNTTILSPPFSNPKSSYISKKSALQTAFRIGKILPGPNHEDFFGIRILVTIFGGYFGSRLMTKIREEKGYTYGIGAYLTVEENYSELHIVTEVGERYTKLVFDEIIAEMKVLQNKSISNIELEKVKAYLLGSLLHNSDGIFNQAILFRNLKKHNSSFDYIDLFFREISTINPNKIRFLAKKYFETDSFSFVACGPPKRKLW